MKYLVDANVLSEPTKPAPAPAVIEWLRDNEGEFVVSAVVLGELQFGILLLPSGAKRTRLLDWFDKGIKRLPTLDFDSATAEAWARLLAKLRRSGDTMPIKDSLIAASAKQHSLTVATRNIPDFKKAAVKVVNPFGE